MQQLGTTDKLTLVGADGYNHGVDILNDMCKALYSNGKAIARSINVEDINSKTTYDPTKDNNYQKYGTQPYTYTNRTYPSIYDAELGSTGDILAENEATKNLLRPSQGVRNSDGTANYTKYTGFKKANLKPTFTYYLYGPEWCLDKSLGENAAIPGLIKTGSPYYLASRCVRVDDVSHANFCIRGISDGGNVYPSSIFDLDRVMGRTYTSFRPIVSLPISTTWSEADVKINDTPTWDISF